MAAAIVPTPPWRWRQDRHELALPFVFRGPSNYIQIEERTGQTGTLLPVRLPHRAPPRASSASSPRAASRYEELDERGRSHRRDLTSFVTWRVEVKEPDLAYSGQVRSP